MHIDYSPLDEQVPQPIQSDLTDIPKFSNTAGALVLTVFIVVFSSFLILPIFLSPLIFIALKKYIDKSGYSAIRLSNFAVRNGFRYRWGVKGESTFEETEFIGVLGGSMGVVKASNRITGRYNDFDFELFNPYTKGMYSVMKISLKNKYPHIVLDSKQNNKLISNIGHFFSEKSRIHLEGNFDDYFKVYSSAPAIDSLRILSPDMMVLLIDYGHRHDIEIVEDSLHIISNYSFSDKQGVESFFVIADTLLNKLDRRLATVSSEYDFVSKVK